MRIGLITTSFPAGESDVSGVFVATLAQHIAALCDVVVLTPDGGQSNEMRRAPYEVRRFRYAPKGWQRLAHRPGGVMVALEASRASWLLLPPFAVAMLFAAVRLAGRVDVLHANWSPVGVLAGVAAWLRRVPLVTTLRGGDVSRAERSFLHGLALRACLALSSVVTVVGSDMHCRLLVSHRKHRHKLRIIPNGVDGQLLSIRELASRNDAPFNILYVGSLVPLKGVDVLLDACSRIGREGEWRMRVVGGGHEAARLQQRAVALGLSGKVEFTGAVPHECMPVHYAWATVLVLPSYSEGRPNVVVEALAAGRPVVASDIPGVTELVIQGRTGLTFPAGDAQALTEAIRRLMRDEEMLLGLGRKARSLVRRQGLDWSSSAERYFALYRELLENRPAC